jgi:hypothetical protein
MQKPRSLPPGNVLIFDTRTHTFSQDVHGHGDFPTSLSEELRMCSGRFPHKLAFLLDSPLYETPPCPGASLWLYEPFPENRWRCVFMDMGSDHVVIITDLVCVGQKSYLFFSGRTTRQWGWYIELEKFLEEMEMESINLIGVE